MSDDTLTDLPDISDADLHDAMGIEPDPGAAADPDAEGTTAQGSDDPGDEDPEVQPEPGREELPEYRRVAIENRELKERLEKLERQLAAKAEPAPAKPEAPLDDKAAAIQKARERLFELEPGLKELVEARADILAGSRTAKTIAAREEMRQNQQATDDLRSVADQVAARVMGDGKTGADLRPQARERIAQAFAKWCGADWIGQDGQLRSDAPKDVQTRAQRYERADKALFKEFVDDYVADFTPASRPDRIAAADRARAKSPRGGPSSAPPPTAPKPPEPGDEDAMHRAAFAEVRAAAAAR